MNNKDWSSFQTEEGMDEYFFCLDIEEGLSFKSALEELYKRYLQHLSGTGLSEHTLIFSRFFLSDVANQATELSESDLFRFGQNGAISVVEQRPMSGGKLAFHSYHVKSKEGLKKEADRTDGSSWTNSLEAKGTFYSIGVLTNLLGKNSNDSHGQTEDAFLAAVKILKEKNLTILDNMVRSWIYIRDIDNNYAGMVNSRKEFFLQSGLTKDTRYLASTGIEGKLLSQNSIICLEAIYLSGLKAAQILRMDALENLNPTHEYGVTFERGTRIRFGDRSHLYISGTASIDHSGRVLYPNDPERQTHRALDNVEALLKNQGASLKDMAYFLVYLRDPSDFKKVEAVLKERISSTIPRLLVEGAVCRPEWLVEIEGLAIIRDQAPYPVFR